MYWAICFALIGLFLSMRVCFVPFHYWSWHFAELERDYRYQYFIRGLQLVFLKLCFCSLLNLNALGDGDEPMDAASVVVAVCTLCFLMIGMGIIFFYVFSLRKMPMKKMR